MRPRRDPRPAAARVAGDEADGPPTSVEQQQGSEGRDWWSGLDLRTATRWFGLLLGQTTLLGTLLFYFGWVRTQSLLLHFGLDNNLVRQSWSDYILRAPNLVVRGLTFLALALLLPAYLGAGALFAVDTPGVRGLSALEFAG